jgi:hypothetical protein
MKNILIPSLLLVLVGCGPRFPDVPVIEDDYLIDVELNADGSVRKVNCVHFDVVSVDPYKIANPTLVDVKECHQVGGHKPEDRKDIFNFIDDLKEYAKKNKKKL